MGTCSYHPSLCPMGIAGWTRDVANVVMGSLLSTGSAFVFALSFVISEGVMSCPNPPNPARVSSIMGISATLVCGLYLVRALRVLPVWQWFPYDCVCIQVCVTVPNWDRFVLRPIALANGSLHVIVVSFAVMTAAQVVHIVSHVFC
jgi:hypothetical protein